MVHYFVKDGEAELSGCLGRVLLCSVCHNLQSIYQQVYDELCLKDCVDAKNNATELILIG